jgi:hypothetical protein
MLIPAGALRLALGQASRARYDAGAPAVPAGADPRRSANVTNPWLAPLMMSSASVIAMRTWMLWPVDGRSTAWQRREAGRMVGEKLEAVREAQVEALALAWQAWFAPWSVWGPMAGRGLPQAMASATETMVRPFGRRAAANAKRLGTRAVATTLPAVAWPQSPWPWPAAPTAAVVRPGRRRTRR